MRQNKTTWWRESLHAIVATIIVCATCIQAPAQKSQSSDLQVLKDRLQWLEQEMHELPLNGRNFTQLLITQPGVNPVNTAQGGM